MALCQAANKHYSVLWEERKTLSSKMCVFLSKDLDLACMQNLNVELDGCVIFI